MLPKPHPTVEEARAILRDAALCARAPGLRIIAWQVLASARGRPPIVTNLRILSKAYEHGLNAYGLALGPAAPASATPEDAA